MCKNLVNCRFPKKILDSIIIQYVYTHSHGSSCAPSSCRPERISFGRVRKRAVCLLETTKKENIIIYFEHEKWLRFNNVLNYKAIQ